MGVRSESRDLAALKLALQVDLVHAAEERITDPAAKLPRLGLRRVGQQCPATPGAAPTLEAMPN